jgi:hypothetical protein
MDEITDTVGEPFIPEPVPRRRINERDGRLYPTAVVFARDSCTRAVRSDLKAQLLGRPSAEELLEELAHYQHLVVEGQHYTM